MRLVILILALLSPNSYSHQVDSVELEFLRLPGEWALEGLLDIAYMLPDTRGVEGAPPLFRPDVMAASAEEHAHIRKTAESTMRKLLELRFDGKSLPWTIQFPDFEKKPLVLPPETGDWALMRTRISTKIPSSPGKLEIFWHDDLESELIVIIEEGDQGIGLLSISSGMSAAILEKTSTAGGDADNVVSEETYQQPNYFNSWVISGFRHVVPLGLDHLLFILGLFLLVPKLKPLLGQSLLFTFAHSITLALTVFGILSFPIRLIEILIAASIAWIGIENVIVKRLKPSRLGVIFIFGLLHGMGFASVLGEKLANYPDENLILPLVGFNLGVELAQVSVLIIAFLVLWPFRRFTPQVRVVGSLLVAAAGLFWMFERIFA